MKSVWTPILVLGTLVLSSATIAQGTCDPVACAGWGDINFLSATCGGTDETMILQADFDCLGSCGGTLVFPANGDCGHAKEISIVNGANFHIEGNGATLRNLDNTQVTSTEYGGIRVKNSQNFSIRNLTLDGNRQHRPTPEPPPDDKPNHLLLLRGVEDVELENIRAVNSTADGFYLRSSDPTSTAQDLRRVQLIGCSSENSWRHGLAIVAGSEIQILGGSFSAANGAITLSGDYFSGGIRIETDEYDPMKPEVGDPDEAISDVLIQGAMVDRNEAVGIHIREATDQPVERIQILGNSLRGNKRGQMFIHGRNVLVADNLLEGFTYDQNISEIAGILVMEAAQEVTIQGNTVSNFDPGPLNVIFAETGVEKLEVRGNAFRNILLASPSTDTSASAPAVIRSEAANSVITGNTIHTSDIRGLLLTTDATSSVVADNSFYGMTLNVMYINGEDTVVSGNRIAEPRGTAGSGKAESVIRVRSDLGTAVDNVVECATTSQRGYLFEKSPVIVADNVAEACNDSQDPLLWLVVEGPPGATQLSGNYLYP